MARSWKHAVVHATSSGGEDHGGCSCSRRASPAPAGNTALHFSVGINHLRGVRKLLRYGTRPWLANKAGKTPLHFALEAGKLKACRLLMAEKQRLQLQKPKAKLPNLINMPVRPCDAKNRAAPATEHTNMSPKKKQKKQALTEAEVAERFCSICGVPVPGAYTWPEA